MVCRQCGKEIVAGTKFCTQCGAQLVDDFSMLHNASATQPVTPMPSRPESAPVQRSMPQQNRTPQQNGVPRQSGAASKDRNRILLIAGLAGGGAVLLILLIVVALSVMRNLSGKIDLKGAASPVAAAEEDAADPDAGQSKADALAQVADAGEDSVNSSVMEEGAAAPVQMNRNEQEAAADAGADPYAAYILPESDTRYYTKAELSALSPEELRLARNEIFARHGRIYESADLREYFYAQSWYEPLYTAEEFDPHMDEILNRYEKANVETIKDLENGEETGALYTVTVDAPDNYVNLREGPGTDYYILMEIPNGVTLNVYEEVERGRWLRTEYRGDSGWIAASQVKRN